MKKNVFLVVCAFSICFNFFGQEKTKNESYIEKIKAVRKSQTKRAMGLEKLDNSNKDEMSSKWIKKGDKILINAISQTDVNELKRELATLGFTDLKIHGKVVTGWGPMDSIPQLENCISLTKAMPELIPTTNVGLTTNQAVTTLFSESASNIFDVNGEGIRIGIISDSFNARGDAQTTVLSGDIPGVGNPNGFTQPVQILSEIQNIAIGGDEGRGMAELIHDIAPGAELYFYSAFNGFFDFADGIRELADAGCDVIVDDIRYFFEPYFQDGAIAQAVDDVVADGVVYLSSAGNSARKSYENSYNPIVVDGLEFHDFGGGDTSLNLRLNAGDATRLVFQWDDPSSLSGPNNPAPDTDLDIFLIDVATEAILSQSAFDNTRSGIPVEQISYTNDTDGVQEVALVIERYSGPTPRRIKYIDVARGRGSQFVDTHEGVNSGTCIGHANTRGAITTGAQAYFFNPEFGRPIGLNSFSSFGGTPILLDGDGNPIEAEDRQKPDVVGTDGGNTTSFPNPNRPFSDPDNDGFPNFFGTSASAPNIAAVVALMLQEKSDLTPNEVITILEETAIDMDNPVTPGFDVGYDIATGNGFVQADKALASLQGKPTVYRYRAINSSTDAFVRTLRDGNTLDLARINGALINIEALATDGLNDVKSMVLNLSGDTSKREQDSTFPFSLYGDDGNGDFRNGEIKNGEYTLSSNAFSQMNGRGNFGEAYEIDFQVNNSGFVSSFILVDADTNEDIAPLTNSINRSLLRDARNITIRANVSSPFTDAPYVEKVVFNLSGAFNQYRQDVSAPFVFNAGLNFQNLVAGDYSLETVVSARRNGDGTDGEKVTFNFEIIDDVVSRIASQPENESLTIANSSSSEVTVSSSSAKTVNFAIYNGQGIQVYNGSVSHKENRIIPTNTLGSGLFIIKSFQNNSTSTKFYLN